MVSLVCRIVRTFIQHTETNLPSSPGCKGCWSCGWRMARSSSGRGSEPWWPGGTGGRPWRWCPSAADLGGHGPPWRIPQGRHAATRHGNQWEGRLAVKEGGREGYQKKGRRLMWRMMQRIQLVRKLSESLLMLNNDYSTITIKRGPAVSTMSSTGGSIFS